MANEDIFAPGFKAQPYWWEDAPIRPMPQPALPARCGVVVIGGGYAGLSAARMLAMAGEDVHVLEAQQFGFGASTRNGGMVSGGANIGKGANLAKRLGEDGVRALMKEAAASYEHFEEVIASEAIDCEYREVGRFTGAHTPGAYAALEAKVEWLNAWAGARAYRIPKEEQHLYVATDAYHGGMVVERTGGIHPAKYFHALVAIAQRRGATLHPNTAVMRVAGSRGSFRVQSSRGEIAAAEVLVATNGYTGTATPWHRRRVVPVASNVIATEEIGEEKVAQLFPGFRMCGETARILNYYRPSPDHRRIVFGGRASFSLNKSDEETAYILHRRLVSIFPQIQGIRVSHAWSGNVAFTIDRVAHIGENDGIHYALGCNGSGIVTMSYLGHRVALKMLRRETEPSAFERLDMPTIPLYSGNPWFLPVVGNYYRLRDVLDRAAAPRCS